MFNEEVILGVFTLVTSKSGMGTEVSATDESHPLCNQLLPLVQELLEIIRKSHIRSANEDRAFFSHMIMKA